jgi:hypothetical protein
MERTCPHCNKTFLGNEHVDSCPYCYREIRKPTVFHNKHFVQYHKTDEYGPPGNAFAIETDKSVDNLHGNTVWLISGEGSPKQYYLECNFVVSKIGAVGRADYPKYFARGEKGVRPRRRILLNDFPWFPELKKSLGVLRGLGLSEIGLNARSELEKVLQADVDKPKVKPKKKKAAAR